MPYYYVSPFCRGGNGLLVEAQDENDALFRAVGKILEIYPWAEPDRLMVKRTKGLGWIRGGDFEISVTKKLLDHGESLFVDEFEVKF